MRALLITGLLVAFALAPRGARAEPSDADRALAQSLFDEGRALVQVGKYHEACDRFARSQKLDPGGGTLLNLALCHEKEGKTATAYVEYNEALSLALRDGRKDREDLARERLHTLGPSVPRARIHVAAPPPGLTLTLDGAPLSSQVLAGDAAPVPIDPGTHVLEARAPDRVEARVDVNVTAEATTIDVELPVLARIAAQPPERAIRPYTPGPASEPEHGARRTAGFLVGGLGLAVLGVGAGFGVDALSKQHAADAACPTSRCADASAVSTSEHAVTSAWIANVAIGAGLVALGVGVYLLVTSPSRSVDVR